jgi:enolase-phosphatase E1
MISAIICDIEGTTSSLSFVKEVLFPYARTRLPGFIREHASDLRVRSALKEVADMVNVDHNNDEALINQLLQWIDEDKKITPLKALQGMVWEAGYGDRDFTGHVYPDAVVQLRRWHAQRLRLYLYSSGSVQAQRLLFAHTEAGDLTPLFSGYYDTRIGAKKTTDSYQVIAREIDTPPAEILFLSDADEELRAARSAGLHVAQVLREGVQASAGTPQVKSFDEINLSDYR